MKYVNPGIARLFDSYTGAQQKDSSSTRDNDINALKLCSDTGNCFYLDDLDNGCLKVLDTSTKEIWVSFNTIVSGHDYRGNGFGSLKVEFGNDIPYFVTSANNKSTEIKIKRSKNNLREESLYSIEKGLYSTEDLEKINWEIHIRLGEDGRIDVWRNCKLALSYRSPSNFSITDTIPHVRIGYDTYSLSYVFISSIIIQDTRRIGLERFQKLTVDPATEQNIPAGGSISYTLSGIPEGKEYEDITSVIGIIQPTSRDAKITTGTFKLGNAEIGTVDVSDSSGNDYELAHAETNSATGKNWTRDDIEGKTMTFTVNGAD